MRFGLLIFRAASLALSTAALAATPAAQVERGRYLVSAGNCVSCHTRPGGAPFSGGLAFVTPAGTIYSTNITPDVETGIGRWRASDLRKAMREGVAAGGYSLFPVFPYTSFTKVSDEDVAAIYVYLRTLKPIRYKPPPNSILFSQRWAMKLWNALYFKPARFTPDTARSSEWNRGAYLVEGLGHCSACHSPRNFMLAEVSNQAYAGGALLETDDKGRVHRWSGVNLTSAKSGLSAWSMDDIVRYLGTGFSPRAGTFGPMNEVIVNSTSHLEKGDLHAMAIYIKSLPARGGTGPWVTSEQGKAGEGLYTDRCQKCHMASGRGGMFNGPPLAGSAVVQAEDPASLINIILQGPKTPEHISFGTWETMKPYSEVLSDTEVAAICNYVRSNWGNHALPVTPSDVARQR